jgi:membrane peptidoglycan carboxypeptidase
LLRLKFRLRKLKWTSQWALSHQRPETKKLSFFRKYVWLVFIFIFVFCFLVTTVLYYYFLTPLGPIEYGLSFKGVDASGKEFKRFLKVSDPSFVKSRNLPKYVIGAILVSEDCTFYYHHGFDLSEIGVSLREAFWGKARLRGASTISQQVVKNSFLNQERSFLRKFEEALYTYKMERRLSKERILDYYLNLVEWAPGIYGIGEASRKYFGTEPKDLTPEQAALLAFFIPSPKARGQAWEKSLPSAFREERVSWTLRQMNWQGYFKTSTSSLTDSNWTMEGSTNALPTDHSETLSNESSNANLSTSVLESLTKTNQK